MKYVLLLVASLLVLACGGVRQEENWLAKTENYKLSIEELREVAPKFKSKEDSIKWSESYILNWMKEKSFLEKARLTLSSEEIDFSHQLENYKNSLVRHRFEEWIVFKYLDTVVTKEEVESYYTENKSSFLLLDYMVQPHFVSVDLDLSKKKKKEIKKLFKSKKAGDWKKLDKLCYELDADYELFDSTWYKWKDFSGSFDLKIQKTSSWLRYNNFIEFEDSLNYHLILFEDYKLKNQVSPLEFEKEKIKKIILLKRKLKLIKEKKEELYQDYLSNIEVYE